MAKLSFLDQLNEEQLEYARRVGEKAKEMGIPPALAISIAYHESRLNPNVGRGSSGEFGIMQVMPNTGKGMGYTNKDLSDTDKNIEAGLKYLKQNYDTFGGDARLATIGYNAGTDSPFFSGGELPKVTEDYLKAMKGYGAFATQAAQPQEAQAAQAEEPQETDEQRDARMQSAMDEQEKRQAQLIGAGTGAGISAARLAGSGAGAVIQAGAKRAGQGFRAGMQGSAPTAPAAPSIALPGAPAAPAAPGAPGQSIMRQPIPSGGPDAGRMAPGQTGTMPYNYAKAAGLTDIEAGRALDMTKQAGGVHDLTTQRREGLGKIQSLFPSERYIENPRFGGIMTPDQGVGGGPRQSFKMQGALPAADLPPNFMPGPAAPPPQGTLVQLPPRQPIPTTPIPPKPPSGLETVTNLFKGMMRPVATAASTVGRYAFPPLALASAAGEAANIAQQAGKPEGQRDLTSMGLSGLNVLGAGMSLFPPTAPVGIPLAAGSALTQEYRNNPEMQEYLRQKMQGMARHPLLDEMTGPLP
jgi:hypothetical protein